MVKLTQIDDDAETEFQEEQTNTTTSFETKETENDEDYEDVSEEDEDDDEDDDFDENETILERIAALKDIVPPKQRAQVSNLVSGTYSFIYSSVSKAGNATWILTTSALLLGVPLSLSILAEQQLIELEKEFKLQQGANDILATGDSTAAAGSTAAADPITAAA